MITAQEAVDRGTWMVKLPSMALLFGPMVLYIVASMLDVIPSEGSAGFIWFLPTFVLSFGGGWLAWSIQVPKWRLWAYARVANLDELRRLAVAAQLIWPKGHVLERTEIASPQLWARIRALEAEKSRPR